MGISPQRRAWLRGLMLSGAAMCVGIVAWQLLAYGPFLWHVKQDRYWQGALEACMLAAALGALQLWRPREWRMALSLGIAALYLRRHAVDAALLVDLVYLELIIALGALVVRSCGGARAHSIVGYLRCFVLGFAVWSVAAWSASALGFGSVGNLRALTALLLLPALYARGRPWCGFVEQRVAAMPRWDRFAVAVLAAWFLAEFAHSATALGYDSQWYGLRGERILAGAGSVFVSQGLVSPVYYFPKVYELFLMPLSGLGSSSVIAGMSILMLGLIATAAYDLLGRLGVRSVAFRIAGAALAATLPAAANIALEAKPDVLAAFLLIFAWVYAAEFSGTRSRAALLWSFALLLLSTQAKLTAIPYAGALALTATIMALRDRERPAYTTSDLRIAVAAAALCSAVTAFATARTLFLTGLPTIAPDPLVRLWQTIGLTPAFPVGILRWSYPTAWSEILTLAIDLLFAPQRLLIIAITWTGNVWLWLALIALCARSLRSHARMRVMYSSAVATNSFHWPGLSLAITAFVLMLCWGYEHRGGDGNYFIAGLIPATLLALAAAWRQVPAVLHRSLLACTAAFCLFQAVYSFASASWTGGTRGFDLDFTRSPRNLTHGSREWFEQAGIARIAAHLRGLHRNARVIGCSEDGDTLGMRLPASYENMSQIGYAHHDLAMSEERFTAFLKRAQIEYLLIPIPTSNVRCDNDPVLHLAAGKLHERGIAPLIADERYELYAVNEIR